MTSADEQWHDTLPRKRVSSGAVFRDVAGRVLLVDPVYKEPWEIPGGATEDDESPAEGCRREVGEELGLDVPVGRLLVVDYVRARAPLSDGLLFVFDGGVLGPEQLAAIRAPADELAGWALVEPSQLALHLTPRMVRRVEAALAATRSGATVYLEDGEAPVVG